MPTLISAPGLTTMCNVIMTCAAKISSRPLTGPGWELRPEQREPTDSAYVATCLVSWRRILPTPCDTGY